MDQAIAEVVNLITQNQVLKAQTELENAINSNPKSFSLSQNSFELNIAGRLVYLLNLDLNDEDTIAVLQMTRACCLLHRPSRSVFNGKLQLIVNHMQSSNSDIQEHCVYCLVAVLVHNVEAIREIEKFGLKLICTQFKKLQTSSPVKLAILQFLLFYLIPETQHLDPQSIGRKNTKDKQQVLSKYLSNVDGLVREFETNKPFGDGYVEW